MSDQDKESGNGSSNAKRGFWGDIAGAATSGGGPAIPGLASFAGTQVRRTVGGVARGSAGAATGLARDIRTGEPISKVVDHRVEQVRSGVWSTVAPRSGARRGTSYKDLRARGDALLDLSWNPINQPRDDHPAFARILEDLTPDEARIVRFLAVAGPQPAVDVRTKAPFGIGSERVAGGLSLVAEMAGCTWPDRDQHYLANLNRHGLVRFSEEPVEDRRRYSLVEAQPKVAGPMKKVKKAITQYRSIYISLFGKQFAEVCFTLEGYTAGGWDKPYSNDRILGKGTPEVKDKHH